MHRLFWFANAFAFAQITSTMAMPIPTDVKEVVGFVFVSDPSGQPKPQGTGFFVAVKDPKKADRVYGYFVTAKHVIQTEDQKAFRAEVFIRLNGVNEGPAEFVKLPLITEGKNKNVFVHPDPTVDIAVMPAAPDQKHFQVRALGDDMLTTKEKFKELKIREGSEVFFAGLFAPFVDTKRIYPIVRFGRVALVSEERIDFAGVKAELYLMETNSYGGNSGAPVFFYLGSDREPGSVMVGSVVLELAGVMSGRFNDAIAVEAVNTTVVPFVRPNLGIAGVVPAYKLHEILFSPELVEFRESHSRDEQPVAPKSK